MRYSHFAITTVFVASSSSFASAFLSASSSLGSTQKQVRATTFLSATKKKVFIDGEAGTTGLQVRQRLEARQDLEIISPPAELRKDAETRKKFINEADAVILCLPDAAAIEAVNMVSPDNKKTVLIDASTAFRTNDSWTYGFPGKIL